MKRFSKLLGVFAVFCMALVSCNKDKVSDVAYYTIEPKFSIKSSGTDVSAIDQALDNRHQAHYSSEKEARSEWNAFIDAVDDKSVVFGDSESYYKFSLVLKDVKGEDFVTVKVLETIDWDQSGRHNPSIH